MAVNRYSRAWFDTFLLGFPPEQTEAEVAFLARHLPLPPYSRVLDLCCGVGRHAILLAARGYQVTGLDIDPYALDEAKCRAAGTVRFVQGDMRDLTGLQGEFDAILNLWQSFGYFGDEINKDVLKQVHGKLRPGGRLVLDIYNRGFFEEHQGDRTLTSGGRTVLESKRMEGNRLTVQLDYGPSQPPDTYNWQLYSPEGIIALTEGCGSSLVLACTGFDESKAPTVEVPRMQLVFEKAQV